MKKKISAIVLSGVLLGAVAAPSAALAAPKEQKLSSDLSIEFGGDESNIGDDENTVYANRLALVRVPAAFAFGKQEVKTSGNNFELTSGHEDKQYVVVNDNRNAENGLGKKWNVKARMGRLIQDTTDTNKLELEAALSMKLGNVRKYDIGQNWVSKIVDGETIRDLQPKEPTDTEALSDFSPLPTDITVNNTSAVELETPTLNSQDAFGQSVSIIEQTADRTGDKAVQEGWATKLEKQTIKFATLDKSKVAGKKFKSTVEWTLSYDA